MHVKWKESMKLMEFQFSVSYQAWKKKNYFIVILMSDVACPPPRGHLLSQYIVYTKQKNIKFNNCTKIYDRQEHLCLECIMHFN